MKTISLRKNFKNKALTFFLSTLFSYMPNVSLAADAWASCTPIGVAVFFGSRVHVQCTTGYGNILFFALPASTTAEIQQANELQSLGLAAIAASKPLSLYFDDADTSGVSFGCGANDCRKLRGAILLK